MDPFVGRTQEIKSLEELSRSGRASLVVIKGRRRIGKSRLVEEFGKGKIFLPFSGLAPVSGIKTQDQLNAFTHQIATLFKIPPFRVNDWSDALEHLSSRLTKKPTVILFDEISWMGMSDPTFVSKLKVWWDLVLQKHHSVTLIFCGSISTWIDKNIINSTALFGRVSLYIELTELTISESRELLQKRGFKGSELDLFKILTVVGGVPWYLEQIQTHQDADSNIKRLCFEKNGLLVHEFDRIFNDLFSSRGKIYKKIISLLGNGMRDRKAIQKELGYSASGTLSHYLKALEICGFISKHLEWKLKTGKTGKSIHYRLSDNYLRFFIHYIEPNLAKIEQGAFSEIALSSLPGIEPMLGFQLENLLLKNRSLIFKALGIHVQDIVADNPYIERGTSKKKGCQIDYLIQTRTNTLFVCEIKMRRREIGLEVIDEIKNKIHSLQIPRGFGVAPVLIHLGPVSDSLLKSGYFFRILDIRDL